MQPQQAHPHARQGKHFTPENGTLLSMEDMSELLRMKHPFTKAEADRISQGPPEELLRKPTRGTIIFPCPAVSVHAIMDALASVAELPKIDLGHLHLKDEPWFSAPCEARWLRVDKNLLTGNAVDKTPEDAATVTVICLAEHSLMHHPPGHWPLWAAVTNTESAKGYRIRVRLHHGNIHFMETSRDFARQNPPAFTVKHARITP